MILNKRWKVDIQWYWVLQKSGNNTFYSSYLVIRPLSRSELTFIQTLPLLKGKLSCYHTNYFLSLSSQAHPKQKSFRFVLFFVLWDDKIICRFICVMCQAMLLFLYHLLPLCQLDFESRISGFHWYLLTCLWSSPHFFATSDIKDSIIKTAWKNKSKLF